MLGSQSNFWQMGNHSSSKRCMVVWMEEFSVCELRIWSVERNAFAKAADSAFQSFERLSDNSNNKKNF